MPPPRSALAEPALSPAQIVNLRLDQVRRKREELERDAARRLFEEQAEATRERCRTFHGFVREAWHVLEPKAPFRDNWHIGAIAEHLQAVTDGEINRFLANVPPGTMKSLLCSVMWQAFEWGPRHDTSLRYLSTAFNDKPVTRDTRKTRDLILSDWYAQLWPHVGLVRWGETSFANKDTGTREGIAFGSLTSQRGDRLIIDDPHSTETAESEADRAATTRKFREGATDRLNDMEKSAIVVIMQRLHELDVSGVILAEKMGYCHLMLPMEYEPERRCTTAIGFRDPRSYDGELLDPVRFPPAVVANLKRDKGSYAYAGQYQQRPTAREGGMFQKADFERPGGIVRFAPPGTKWVRYWDLAGTELKKGATRGARSAGVLMGRSPDGGLYIGDLKVAALEGKKVRSFVKATAEEDGKGVEVHLSQDPGQAGKTQALDYIAMLAGWNVRKHLETGDKATRAEPFSAQCEGHNVFLLKGDWNREYVDEVCLFPGGARKDIVDASSGAFGVLVGLAGKDVDTEGLVAPQIIEA